VKNVNLITGLTAFLLGALHALEPGHGKSAIAAYAVGYRSNVSQILVLGITTAIAHTFTILLLAVLVGGAVSTLSEESAHVYIEVGSAFLLVGTGLWLLVRALKERRKTADCQNPESHCSCHGSRTQTSEEKPVSFGVVSLLGISTGLLPCPTALAVLLGSMTTGHFWGGLWIVCLFSVGISLTICGVAVSALVLANSKFSTSIKNGSQRFKVAAYLPYVSAAIIIGSGVFTFCRALLTT
jgi:nickel/cobalt exporter